MNKIDIPQVFVSYAGGSGGEWLAYQIAHHDRFRDIDCDEMEIEINEFNRCRITPSWRMELTNEGELQNKVWLEREFDGTDDWWQEFWQQNEKHREYFYHQVTELTQYKPRYRIPVHRCHEGWQDIFWQDLFTETNYVTVRVDDTDSDAFTQLQSNIIKKIWWQDLSNEQDLCDEMFDKYHKRYKGREEKGQPEDLLHLTGKFSGNLNYTDMMLAVAYYDLEDTTLALDDVMQNISQRWNDYNIKQHYHSLPGNYHVVDFGNMFVRRQKDEYLKLCDFLKITPRADWEEILQPYADRDSIKPITVSDVKTRLEKRCDELQK
jgi:hypothetical protein